MVLRILLIDDSPDDRLLAIRELNRAFDDLIIEEIAEAPVYELAIAAGSFDLVVTDYKLRWNDGISVLRAIKARYPTIPVVMFTNSGDEEVAVEAMKAGLDDYVMKSAQTLLPFTHSRAFCLKTSARSHCTQTSRNSLQ